MIVRCALAVLTAFGLFVSCAAAQGDTYRRSDQQMKELLQRIQLRAEVFGNSMAVALENGGVNATQADQQSVAQWVRNLVQATRRLADRYGEYQTDPGSVEEALRASAAIDGFFWQHSITPQIQDNWRPLRGDLKVLADAYHVDWGWLGPIGKPHRWQAS